MALTGRRVLLTGGTGFIGSRVARLLERAGADVRLLVRASSKGGALGPLWDRWPRLTADLTDAASLAAAVKAADPEYVLHLAKDREGVSFEREARATTALAAALSAGAPRLKRWVRTAHAAAEGLGRGTDAELARALAERFRLPVVTLELYLVYGPGMREGDDLRELAEAARGKRPVTAPETAKDLVYVDDAARAYLLAAESPKALGGWIPVGGGRLVPGAEAAKAALKAAGRRDKAFPAKAPRSGGEPADTKAARELLGWAPETGLDEGMRRLVQWLEEARHG